MTGQLKRSRSRRLGRELCGWRGKRVSSASEAREHRPSQLPLSQPQAPLRGLQPGRGGAHQRVEVIERGKLVAGEAEALELEERGVLQTIQPL